MTVEATGYRDKCFSHYDKVCVACGSTKNIEVHHRDGNRKNNEIDNLIPVCETCHKSIHTRHSSPVNDKVAKLREQVSRKKEVKQLGITIMKSDCEKLIEVKGDRTWREAIKQEFGVSVDE